MVDIFGYMFSKFSDSTNWISINNILGCAFLYPKTGAFNTFFGQDAGRSLSRPDLCKDSQIVNCCGSMNKFRLVPLTPVFHLLFLSWLHNFFVLRICEAVLKPDQKSLS